MTDAIYTSDSDLFFWNRYEYDGEWYEEWTHLRYSSIASIAWPEEQVFTCQYCGNVVSSVSAPCPGCNKRGAVRENAVGKARVILYQYLPALELFNPPKHMRVTFARAGYRIDPGNWQFKMEFYTLGVCRRWVDGFTDDPREPSMLRLFVEIECDVTMEVRESTG